MDGKKRKRPIRLTLQCSFPKKDFPSIQEYILTSFLVLKCSLFLLNNGENK